MNVTSEPNSRYIWKSAIVADILIYEIKVLSFDQCGEHNQLSF